jgi:phage/plasmid-associated DNA primase
MSLTIEKFLDEHDIKKVNGPITHTRFNDTNKSVNRSFCIEEKDYDQLYTFIEEKNSKSEPHIAIVERIPENRIRHFMLDLDLKYTSEESRVNRIEEIATFLYVVAESIYEITTFDMESLECHVFMRDSGYFDKNKNYKDGIHIIIPNFVSHVDTQLEIRNHVLNKIQESIVFDKNINNAEQIFDGTIYKNTGFLLYGTSKETIKNQYKLVDILDINMKEENYILYSNNCKQFKDTLAARKLFTKDNIQFYSQRKVYDSPVYNLNEKYLESIKVITPTPSIKTTAHKVAAKINDATISNQKAAEFTYILSHLNPKRFDDYNSWFKILEVLKVNKVSFEIFNDFSSRSPAYVSREDCLERWNKFEVKDVRIKIGTLYDMFKEDNEDKFTEFQDRINECCTNKIQVEIARVYFELVKDNEYLNKYIYMENTRNWAYLGPNNIWKMTDSSEFPDGLKNDVYDVIRPVFQRRAEFFLDCIMEKEKEKLEFADPTTKEEKKLFKEELLTLKKEIARLTTLKDKCIEIPKLVGDNSKGRDIMAFLKGKFARDIDIRSFNLTHIFAANNMVFDCRNTDKNTIVGWREARPSDMVLHTTKFDYSPVENEENHKFLYKTFESFFDKPENTDFFLRKIARALNGDIEGAHLFNIYLGSSRNGKGVCFKFLNSVFGDYAYTMSSNVITGPETNAESPNPAKYGMIGKRLVCCGEFKEDATINISVVKSITGNDPQTARPLYGKPLEFMPQCHLAACTNTLFKFNDTSNAMDKRNNIQMFPNTFGDVDDGQNLKIADPSLLGKLSTEEMRLAMLQILSKIYIREYSSDKAIRNIPEDIKYDTTDYNLSNDNVSSWIFKYFNINKEDAPKYTPKQLFTQYCDDHMESFSEKKFREFNKTLNNKFKHLQEGKKNKTYHSLMRKTPEEIEQENK